MAQNPDRRNQKTVWDLMPLVALIGTIITAWVNLNGELTQVKIQQEYNEKFNQMKHDEIQRTIHSLITSLSQIKTKNADVNEQLEDLERTITHIYRSRNSQSKK